jgi:DNA-binding MarR family transcriptional regulator
MRNNPELGRVKRLRAALHALNRVVCLRDPLGQNLEADTTPAQLHTIVALGSGPLSMTELGRVLGAGGPTITGVVDRLERMGLVERRRDEEDRRVVQLHLTDLGRERHKGFEALIESRLHSLLGLLDAGDQATLVELFERIAERAKTALTDVVKEKSNAR